MKRGDIVYDVADPRHHGRIEQINHRPHADVAKIVWLETGWKSYGVPVCDLRPAPRDSASESAPVIDRLLRGQL